MPTIPHCDELFHRYFAPYYSDEELEARDFDATRPDLGQFPEYIGTPASELSSLSEDLQEQLISHLAKMTDAATADFGKQFALAPPVDFNWIETIDAYYNVDHIAELIAESDPAKEGNAYYISCIELGVLIAATMKSLVPDLEWLPAWPYWESALWHPASGHIIPPTHWAIKKFSSYGWEDGLVLKIHAGMHALQERQGDIEGACADSLADD